MKDLLKYILISLSILVFLGMAFNCIPTFLWSDQFSFSSSLEKQGVFNFLWKMYMGWDGRHLTPSGITQAIFIKYSNSPITTFIWVICFISSFYILSKIYIKMHFVIITAILSTSFLIIFQSHLFQTLYWSVGGIYMMMLLFGVLWLYYYKNGKGNVYVLYILSFLAGATSQNLSISLIALVSIDQLINYRNREMIDYKQLIVLGFLILGTLYITFAPGNTSRVNMVDEEWTILSKLLMMLNIYKNGLLLTKPIYFIAPIIGLITYKLKKQSENDLEEAIKYIIIGFASLAPFIMLPAVNSEEARITIFFQIFIFLGILHFSWYVIKAIDSKYNIYNQRIRLINFITSTLQLMILGFSLTLLTMNFQKGMEIKKQYLKREEIIKSTNDKQIVIEGISFKGNRSTFMHYFYDITEDTSNSFNRMAATYYNLESIRITKSRTFEK